MSQAFLTEKIHKKFPVTILYHTESFVQGPSVRALIIRNPKGLLTITLEPCSTFSVSFFVRPEEASFETILSWFESYGKKRPKPGLFFDQDLSPFSRQVMKTLIEVPFGSTVSYGELARLSGYDGAARAVGTTCRKNPLPLVIPCHRVVRADGSTGEFAFGPELKSTLLKFESSI